MKIKYNYFNCLVNLLFGKIQYFIFISINLLAINIRAQNTELIFNCYERAVTEYLAFNSHGYLIGDETNDNELELKNGPWENMGSDVQQVCTGGSAATDYEWGVQYNNSSPIIRVTCTNWNVGKRVCTYPPYPTGDAEPFNWGGACWIWGTNSAWDDACSGAGQAYHSYYYQSANGVYQMLGGNGCNALPTVWRRKM